MPTRHHAGRASRGLVDFSLTEEQEQLRRAVRKFAESEILPHVMEWDEASRFPSEIIPRLAEMGLLGIIVPAEYGGAGVGPPPDGRPHEEVFPRGGPPGPTLPFPNSPLPNHNPRLLRGEYGPTI